jgi:hypothetical protein
MAWTFCGSCGRGRNVTFQGRYYHTDNVNVAPKTKRTADLPKSKGETYMVVFMISAGFTLVLV